MLRSHIVHAAFARGEVLCSRSTHLTDTTCVCWDYVSCSRLLPTVDSVSNLADLWPMRHLVSLTYIFLLFFAVYTHGLFTAENAHEAGFSCTNNTKQVCATQNELCRLRVKETSDMRSYERKDNHKT